MEFFMTLIKRSDVRRHLSTKSRENREVRRPYGVDNPAPGTAVPVAVPAVATDEVPAVVPGHKTSKN
jgi:hypothetical protein